MHILDRSSLTRSVVCSVLLLSHTNNSMYNVCSLVSRPSPSAHVPHNELKNAEVEKMEGEGLVRFRRHRRHHLLTQQA